jgi:mRNA-degrading endonuclease HigB of HigAB toxin-antitoxin module
LGLSGTCRILSLPALRTFYERPEYADSKEPLLISHGHVRKAKWHTPADVKADLGTASILKDGRVVFNIAVNKYRLVTSINYPYGIVFVKFVRTHKQYDAIDAKTNEAKHFPMEVADPAEAIKFQMDQKGLTVKDLEPMIGRSNRVYEVLNRIRPLTLPMIWRLHKGLGIPAEALIQPPKGTAAV